MAPRGMEPNRRVRAASDGARMHGWVDSTKHHSKEGPTSLRTAETASRGPSGPKADGTWGARCRTHGCGVTPTGNMQ